MGALYAPHAAWSGTEPQPQTYLDAVYFEPVNGGETCLHGGSDFDSFCANENAVTEANLVLTFSGGTSET